MKVHTRRPAGLGEKKEHRNVAKVTHGRRAFNYKLGPKDDDLIYEALRKFTPVYVIAVKIGCDRGTLSNYIKKTPRLLNAQEEAESNVIEFCRGKLMQKVAAGHAGSIMFALERLDREHFGPRQQIENVGPLPNIVLGTFSEAECPKPTEITPEMATDARKLLESAEKTARKRLDAEMGTTDAPDAPMA